MKSALRYCMALLLLVLTGGTVLAQNDPGKAATDKNGIPLFWLDGMEINADKPTAKQLRQYRKKVEEYERLRLYVRRCYPLAREAKSILDSTNAELAAMGKAKDKHLFMQRLEKDLFKKYEPVIRRMSMAQGKVLVKLIYRETDNSVFEILKEHQNGAAAGFWQLVAKLFGGDLKAGYVKENEPAIEHIIAEINRGQGDRYTITYNK